MAVVLHGAQTMPTNPNGVAFAANARDVLQGRRWVALLASTMRAMEAFHRDSGLPVMNGFAWRISTDRKNHRQPELLCLFVIDGAATREHLQTLETAMSRGGVYWSASQIERIPVDMIRASMWADGTGYQLWRGTERDPRLESMQWTDSGVMQVQRPVDDILPSELLTDAVQVLGRNPTSADHDTDLERMRLAFAHDFVTRIVEADGKIMDEEQEFVDTVFPEFLLDRLSLSTRAERQTWLALALEELPTRLGHHDKLAMIGLFFSACYSDGNLDAREMRVLKEAGERMGLNRKEVVAYLQRFW